MLSLKNRIRAPSDSGIHLLESIANNYHHCNRSPSMISTIAPMDITQSSAADDDETRPLHMFVQRWSADELSGYGSWSQLRVGGSPSTRSIPVQVSPNFWLAGEAFDAHQPAQVHGAYNSGLDVGKAIYNTLLGNKKDVEIVIIGAGFAGISCAYSLVQCLLNTSSSMVVNIRILEARDRIGGRVHTITMNNVNIDVGGSWLQNCNDNNSLLPVAKELGLTLIPSDFSCPIFALQEKVDKSKEETLKAITNAIVAVEISAEKLVASGDIDMSFTQGLRQLPGGFSSPHELAALCDINADSGLDFDQLSFKQALTEPGIGNGDMLIKEGYISILNHFHAAIKAFYQKEVVEYNSHVKAIDYSSGSSVSVELHGGEVIPCDYCVCTVPVQVLKTQLEVSPPFPSHIQQVLDTIVLGVCDKIILQFRSRWWPSCPSNNLLRWYNNTANDAIMGVTDILDLTDIHSDDGLPTVVFFICGQQNISQFYAKYSNEEEIARYCCDILKEICSYNT